MTIRIIPTEFEIDDGMGEHLAKVEMFDEHGSSVTVSTVVHPVTWPELSAAILSCLQQMHPEAKQ